MSAPRRPRRSTVVLLVAVVLLGVGTYVAYFSPLLVVRSVAVAGERTVEADDVISAAAVPLGTPLARQDVQAIAQRATRIPAVQAASVTRQWPSTVLVTVTERQAVLAVRQGGDVVLVDGSGVVFDRVTGKPPAGAVPAEADPADQALLADIGAVAAALPPELGGQVELVTATSRERIVLELRSGVEVNWGSATDSGLKAQIVTALLKQKPRATIDVSSPNNPAAR